MMQGSVTCHKDGRIHRVIDYDFNELVSLQLPESDIILHGPISESIYNQDIQGKKIDISIPVYSAGNISGNTIRLNNRNYCTGITRQGIINAEYIEIDIAYTSVNTFKCKELQCATLQTNSTISVSNVTHINHLIMNECNNQTCLELIDMFTPDRVSIHATDTFDINIDDKTLNLELSGHPDVYCGITGKIDTTTANCKLVDIRSLNNVNITSLRNTTIDNCSFDTDDGTPYSLDIVTDTLFLRNTTISRLNSLVAKHVFIDKRCHLSDSVIDVLRACTNTDVEWELS